MKFHLIFQSTVETAKTVDIIDAVELQDMTPRTQRAFKGQAPLVTKYYKCKFSSFDFSTPLQDQLETESENGEVEVDIGVEIRLRADSGDERELTKEVVTSL